MESKLNQQIQALHQMVGIAFSASFTREPSHVVAHLSLRSARNTMGTRGTPE